MYKLNEQTPSATTSTQTGLDSKLIYWETDGELSNTITRVWDGPTCNSNGREMLWFAFKRIREKVPSNSVDAFNRIGVIFQLENRELESFYVHVTDTSELFVWDSVEFRIIGYFPPSTHMQMVKVTKYDPPSPFTLPGSFRLQMVRRFKPNITESSVIDELDYMDQYYIWETTDGGMQCKHSSCPKQQHGLGDDVRRVWVTYDGSLEDSMLIIQGTTQILPADYDQRIDDMNDWKPTIEWNEPRTWVSDLMCDMDCDARDTSSDARSTDSEHEPLEIEPQSGRMGPEIQQLKDQRDKKAAESKNKEDRSDYIPKNLPKDLQARKDRKIHDRAGYKKRFVVNRIPALLDRRKNKSLSPLERLRFYNKRHKCIHRLSYNTIGYDKQQNFKFSCDHDDEHQEVIEPLSICQNCGQGNLHKIIKHHSACECFIRECHYCKLRLYTGENNETLYQVTPTAVKVYEDAGWTVTKMSKKRWYDMPNEQEPVECYERVEFWTKTTSIICCCDAARNYKNVASMQLFMHKYIRNTVPWKNRAGFKAELTNANVEVVDLDRLSAEREVHITSEPNTLDKWSDFRAAFMNLVIEKKKSKQRGKQITKKQALAKLGAMKIEPQGGVASAMGNPIELITSKLNELKDKFADLIRTCVSDTLKGILAKVLVFIENLVAGFGKIGLFMYENAWLGPTLMRNLFQAMTGNITLEGMCVVMHLVKTYFHNDIQNFFQSIWDKLANLAGTAYHSAKEALKPTPQVATFDDEVTTVDGMKIDANAGPRVQFKGLLESIIKALGVIFGYVPKTFYHWAPLFKDFNLAMTTGRNLKNIFFFLLDFFPDFIKGYFKATDVKQFMASELKKTESPLYNFARAGISCKLAACRTDPEVHRQAMELFDDAKVDLLVWMKDENIPYYGELRDYIDKIDHSCRIMGIPPADIHEPFTIRISGDSGVGKTTISPLLTSAIFSDKTIKQLADMTYHRNPGTESWDGCLPSHVIVNYDDFNQNRDETDLMELILLCSRAHFMPDYSTIDATQANTMGIKGTIVNPKVVILCSNTRVFQPVHLNSKFAINRRKHVHFDVQWAPGARVVMDDFSHMNIKVVDSDDQELRILADLGTGLDAIRGAQYIVRSLYFKHESKQDNIDQIQEKLRWRNSSFIPSGKVANVIDQIAGYTAPERREINFMFGEENGRSMFTSVDETIEEQRSHSPPLERRTAQEIVPQAGLYMGTRAAFILASAYTGSSVSASLWLKYTGLEWLMPSLFNSVSKTFKGVMLAIAGFAAAFKTYRALWSLYDQVRDNNEANSGENNTRHIRSRLIVPNATQVLNPTLPEVVANNMAQISLENGQFVNAFFVKGNVFMTVKHFFLNAQEGSKWLPEGTKITLRMHGTKEGVVIPFRSDQLAEMSGEKDVVLYRCPLIIPSRATMLNKFFDGSSHLLHRNIISIRYNGERASFHHGTVTRDQQTVYYPYVVNGETTRITQHNTILVSAPTRAGDCGSVVYVDDDLMQNKLVGICIGNNPVLRNSVTVLITRKLIEETLSRLDTSDMLTGTEIESQRGFLENIRPIQPNELFRTEIAGELPIVGVISKTVVPAMKSKIRPSPLYAAISAPTHAVPEFKKFGYAATIAGINKYSDISGGITPEESEVILRSEQEEIYGIPTIIPTRFLTVEEAINGIPTMPYIDRIDTSTSAGAPFVLEGITKKTDLLVLNGDTYTPTPQLQQELQDFEHALDNDKDTTRWTLAIGTLKDEIRPKEKVAQGKIRLFSATGLVMLITMRQYLMPFIAHIIQTRHKSYSAMGLNKASFEWDIMVKRLLEVNFEGFDLDYVAYDSRFMAEVARMYTEFVCGFEKYLREHGRFSSTPIQRQRLRKLLILDERVRHIIFNYIVAILQGNASGSLNTTPKNGFGNSVYCKITWLRRAPTPYKDLYYYRKYVRTIFYGDDALVFVHPEFMAYWNDKAHSEVMAELNITVTTGNKDNSWGAKPIEQLTFLKNTTRKMGPLYVPLKSGYKEQINWIRISDQSPPPEQACEMNCNSALREAFFYGPDEFNSLRKQILALRPEYNLLNYHSLNMEWSQTGKFNDIDGTYNFTKHEESTRFKDIQNDIIAYTEYLQSQ